MLTHAILALTILASPQASPKKRAAIVPIPVQQPVTYTGPKKRVAVSGFDIEIQSMSVVAAMPSGGVTSINMEIDAPLELGTGMETMLGKALVNSKRYIVLERKHFEDINKEIAKQGDPGANPLTNIESGRRLGAQVLIRGSVTEISYKKKRTEVEVGGGSIGDLAIGKGDHVATVTIDLKLVDVATSQILQAVTGTGRFSNKGTSVGFTSSDFRFGNSSFEKSPIAKALRLAIENGVEEFGKQMEKVAWEAKVVTVSKIEEEHVVYLNFGSDAGIPVGTVLEIREPGKPLIDPDTNEVIDREEDRVITTCKVKKINERSSIATIADPAGINAGFIVRILEKKSTEK